MKEMSEYIEVEGISASTYAGMAAKAVKTKVRGIMGDDLLSFKLIDFVSLMMISNKFANKGIFITDDNKEECYIKIIETGDESLITELERYLVLKDDIKKLEADKNEYSEIITKLQCLSDHNNESAVNKIIEDYLRR